MRVALIGNIANVHLRLAHALRDRAGVDAHLYVSSSDAQAWRPENDDPALAAERPGWIHHGDWVNARSLLLPGRSALARELAGYDLVVASGVGPVFAARSGRPWAFLVTGGDLTVKPFPLTFWRWYPSWYVRAGQVVAGYHQRRAVRSADRLLIQPFAPMVEAADRLRIASAARSDRYFPIPVDVERFTPDGPSADVAADATFVVFHPSRLVLDDSPRMRRTGQWKGNDTLVRGFARLVRAGVTERPRLVLIDSPTSRDRDEVRRLVAALGIEDEVVWAVPPEGELFDHVRLAEMYRRADVVAVEFGVGWFGCVALEGAASGRPVLSHVDQQVMAQLYPSHPIVDAVDEVEVGERLVELATSPELRARLGERARRWAVEHHSDAAVAGRYHDELAHLAGELEIAL